MSAPRYIEVIGIPGAGKSTVAKLLVYALRDVGVESMRREPLRAGVFRRLQIVFGICVLVLRSPSMLKLWRYSVAAKYKTLPHARSVARNVRARLFTEAAIIRQQRVKNHATLVNDEGMIGKLVVFSLLAGLNEEQMMAVLGNVLPSDTVVVYVDTPVETAVARALDRDVVIPFFHEMATELRVQFYALNAERYGNICDRMQGVRVPNAAQQDVLKSEIDRLVERLLRYW